MVNGLGSFLILVLLPVSATPAEASTPFSSLGSQSTGAMLRSHQVDRLVHDDAKSSASYVLTRDHQIPAFIRQKTPVNSGFGAPDGDLAIPLEQIITEGLWRDVAVTTEGLTPRCTSPNLAAPAEPSPPVAGCWESARQGLRHRRPRHHGCCNDCHISCSSGSNDPLGKRRPYPTKVLLIECYQPINCCL